MRAESQLKRMKVREEKHPFWAGQHWVGGVLGSRCSSEIDVRAAVKWEGLLELLNTQPPSFHNSLGGFGIHRPRQRLTGSNIITTNTHSPSDTHSHPETMPAHVKTHTLVPELQSFPFKTLFQGHHGDDPTVSSSNVTKHNEFPHHYTDFKQLDKNRHTAMISDPAQEKLVADAKLVLGVESEVELGVDPDVGLRLESEVVFGADSEERLRSETDAILTVESDVGRTINLKNKQYETHNEEANSNMSAKNSLIISHAAAETSTPASFSNASDQKTTRSSTESTNQELVWKDPHHFLTPKGGKKGLQAVNSENIISPNNGTSKSLNSFRKMPLEKSIVSPEPSPSLSSPKLHPLHPVRTLTHTEKQNMRKVISVSSTKPHLITHSQSLKVSVPTTATSVHVSPTPKMSSIHKSLVKKPKIYQKSSPEEKLCKSSLHTFAMPTQESHTHTHKTTPHFAYSTVASSTRSAVTSGNAPLSQKDASITPKTYSPNRTVPHRASGLSIPSRTGSTDLPRPHGHRKNVKVKSVRPVWR